jgi:hypothetical protein
MDCIFDPRVDPDTGFDSDINLNFKRAGYIIGRFEIIFYIKTLQSKIGKLRSQNYPF